MAPRLPWIVDDEAERQLNAEVGRQRLFHQRPDLIASSQVAGIGQCEHRHRPLDRGEAARAVEGLGAGGKRTEQVIPPRLDQGVALTTELHTGPLAL